MKFFGTRRQRTLEIIDYLVGLFAEEDLKRLEMESFEGLISFRELLVLFCGSLRPKYGWKRSVKLGEEFVYSLKNIILGENSRSAKIIFARGLRDRLFI